MKTINSFVAFLSVMFFGACTANIDDVEASDKIPVEVTFSGINISVIPDENQVMGTRATTTEAKVTRIALKVFDSNGKEVHSVEKVKKEGDSDFDNVKIPLYTGNYKFVAVAHKARTEESKVAMIESQTKAELNELYVPSLVYSTVQDVTISEKTSQSVVVNFGKRRTASFQFAPTDVCPENVKNVEISINPTKKAADTPYAFDPSTGYASGDFAYSVTFYPENLKNNTFTGNKLLVSFSPSDEMVQADVCITMRDGDDNLAYSRTLNDVTLKQHCITKAIGNFFQTNVTGNFSFDIENDASIEIPLNP